MTQPPNDPPNSSDDPVLGEIVHGRIQPIDLQLEMQRSYLDYAMSVIVSRALPDVRDGLKPVHRRVLYAMYDGGYRPDRSYSKCARVVGDVMGNYHPHGDSAIYDTLVRLAQPWALRYPLVDGQGNFGSPGNDPAAAMRYCVTGDTRVLMADGSSPTIAELAPGATPDSDTDVDLKVAGKDGLPVRASKVFHSGDQRTLRLRTTEGHELVGSLNHPVLTLRPVAGVPTLQWSLLEELRRDDVVVLSRPGPLEWGAPTDDERARAVLAGAWVSEGWASPTRAGFNNTDGDWFTQVLDAYDRVVGGPRYVSTRTIRSGSVLREIDVQDLTALRRSFLGELVGLRSEAKVVPAFVWESSSSVKSTFLRSLFTGDGSASLLARNAVQISYSTRSSRLAREVQQLLLELGIVSRVCVYANGEHKVVVSNRRDANLFAHRVGFMGDKGTKLTTILMSLPERSSALSSDHVPFLADFLREHGATRWTERDWLRRHNVDRIERWANDRHEILDRLDLDAADVAIPLVDGRYYYTRVASVEDAGVQPVYSLRIDTDDHAFVTNGFVSHNTECRMMPLAMEMVRDIDKDTVDFAPNYDGKTQEPTVLPARFPNLLVNGSAGIAVGMATNIPPHNLREVGEAVQWFLANPEADDEELLGQLLLRIKGPDFPTRGLIMGTRGIEDAYRTGRGAITMRAKVEVEEDNRGRTCLVVTELPYQVNPDNLKMKIAELVDSGRLAGISDLRDDTSNKTGLRIVLVLKRDAIAKVVLNNLYKHTQLQDTFGANMLAIVDGVPRTLSLDKFVRYWVEHQIEVIVRRTRWLLAEAEKRAHLVRGYVKALDALDEVIALIRRSPSADEAKNGLMALLDVDEDQALAILGLQLRRLAALERQAIIDELAELELKIADYNDILASPARQRTIISEELAEIVAKFGDERRTVILPFDGDMDVEDLIPEEEVVVTITRGGYAKRTRSDNYRAQRRGGKGVKGAQLRGDDVVEHFFVTTTHHWMLFFTNLGRVYRAKGYELPEAGRDAKGQHVANLLAFQPGEQIAQVLDIPDYEAAEYLVLATRDGKVKKTRLSEYDSNRSGGVIAINLLEGDELVSARLVGAGADIVLVSRKGMSVRFTADDEALRPMGRATSGVTGMKFREGDRLLSMDVVHDDAGFVFVVTDGGWAKRTSLSEYRVQGRGGLGIKVAKLNDERGELVAGMVVGEDDEVLVVMEHGKVVRSPVAGVPAKGRDTMGVVFAKPDAGDRIIAVARNTERALGGDDEDVDGSPAGDDDSPSGDGAGTVVTDGVALAVEALTAPDAAPVDAGADVDVAGQDGPIPDGAPGDDEADGNA